MANEEGWVYVLTSEAIPGLLKIGWTMKDPATRSEDQCKDPKTGGVTGVPMPFILVYKALVVNPKYFELRTFSRSFGKRLPRTLPKFII